MSDKQRLVAEYFKENKDRGFNVHDVRRFSGFSFNVARVVLQYLFLHKYVVRVSQGIYMWSKTAPDFPVETVAAKRVNTEALARLLTCKSREAGCEVGMDVWSKAFLEHEYFAVAFGEELP